MFKCHANLLYLFVHLQWVSPSSLIPSFTPELGDVIKYLQTAPVIRASLPHVGTQLKVMLTLEGGQKALLKPQWYMEISSLHNVTHIYLKL